MKELTDFKIFYKDEEITNILYMAETKTIDYREEQVIPCLKIQYINKDGKLLLREFEIDELTFEEKENLQQKLSEIQVEKEKLEHELVNKENVCNNYKHRIDNAIEYINNATITENTNTYIENLLEILEEKMTKKTTTWVFRNHCPYSIRLCGDGIEETGGFDYDTCKIKNQQDVLKYDCYDSVENICNYEENYNNCPLFKIIKGEVVNGKKF